MADPKRSEQVENGLFLAAAVPSVPTFDDRHASSEIVDGSLPRRVRPQSAPLPDLALLGNVVRGEISAPSSATALSPLDPTLGDGRIRPASSSRPRLHGSLGRLLFPVVPATEEAVEVTVPWYAAAGVVDGSIRRASFIGPEADGGREGAGGGGCGCSVSEPLLFGVVDGSISRGRKDTKQATQGRNLSQLSSPGTSVDPFQVHGVLDGRIGSLPKLHLPDPGPPGGPAPADLEQYEVLSAEHVGALTATPCVIAGHGVDACDALSPPVYGTDLGFSADWNGKTYFLFGDTWVTQFSDHQLTPVDSVPGKNTNNDMMASIESNKKPGQADPATGVSVECPKLDFFTENGTYKPIEVNGLVLDNLATPLAVFSTKTYLYGVFTSKTSENTDDNHAQIARYLDTSTFFGTIGERLDVGGAGQLYTDASLHAINVFDRFFNVAVASAPDGFDSTGIPSEIKTPIFVWGRAYFSKWLVAGVDPEDKLTDLFLMILDGNQLDMMDPSKKENIKRYYFIGYDPDGNPQWDSDENTIPAILIHGKDDIDFPAQMTVAYDPNLSLWVMLYGGSYYDKDLQPSGAVQTRLAHNPWGPWSSPMAVYGVPGPGTNTSSKSIPKNTSEQRNRTLFNPKIFNPDDPKLCFLPHQDANGNTVPAMCIPGYVQPDIALKDASDPSKNGTTWMIPGIEYGAALWCGATQPYQDDANHYSGAVIYFLMSTLNPYHAVLMKMTLAQKITSALYQARSPMFGRNSIKKAWCAIAIFAIFVACETAPNSPPDTHIQSGFSGYQNSFGGSSSAGNTGTSGENAGGISAAQAGASAHGAGTSGPPQAGPTSSPGSAGNTTAPVAFGPEGPSCAAGLLCAGVSCCESRVVPATTFSMGRSQEGTDAFPAADKDHPEEQPEHEVFVDAFALDTFEVTVGRFRAFALAFDGAPPAEGTGAHPNIPGSGWQTAWNKELPASQQELLASLVALPDIFGGGSQPGFFGTKTWTDNPGMNEDKPINFIKWTWAFAFCAWDGGRLPTEAEWECAASGGEENRLSPWGSTTYTGNIPPPEDTSTSPVRVGQYPSGRGRWGHQDLAGSTREWVLDWFSADWYKSHETPGSCHNCANLDMPTTSPTNDDRVFRGLNYRVAYRGYNYPQIKYNNGIRCARLP